MRKIKIDERIASMLPYQKWVFETVSNFYSLENTVVMEVGGVPNQRAIADNLVGMGASRVIQINNRKDLLECKQDAVQYIPMDARNTDFPDGYFDVVYSASVLEHLLDLDHFLSEMYRVLKPKGILCLHGGAFWNSAWGHHLWVHTNGYSYEFNGNNPLPNWSHLYMDRMEMKDYLLADGISADHVQKIVSWVYDGNEINRFFYDDYVKAFNNSRFEIVGLMPKNWKIPVESMKQKLRSIYGPGISNFSIGEAVVVLRK